MQEHTNKDSEASRSRSNPIHIVPTSRQQAGANADALRDVHMSLVRAEQNLYNLVQASHANGQAGFNYAAGPPAFTAGYAAPAFPPGFAPAGAISSPSGVAYGSPLGPAFGASSGITYGFPAQPNPWVAGQPMSSWNPLTPGIASIPGVGLSPLPPLAGVGLGALPGIGIPGIASPWTLRTPACDLSDEGKAFVCVIDLPGVRADQVELLCFPHSIAIHATRETDAETASLVVAERAAAMLQRTITLPTEIEPSTVKASLSNGILTVTLPKVHPTEGPRRIKVQG